MIAATALLAVLVQASPSPWPSPSPSASPSPSPSPWTSPSPAPSAVAPPRPAIQGDFAGADGVRLAHRRVGTGAKVVVFLSGGAGMSLANAAPLEALAGTARSVVFYDQRGSGLADPVSDPELLSLDHHVRDLEALRLHLSVQRMALIGHGAGAPIAAEYAADHPAHVERLVLLHPGSLEDSDLPATVERLTAPALVIDGMRSNASLTSSREWAGMLPNARLLLVPRAGGDVLADQPARVTAALKQFLAGRHPPGSEVVPGPDAH